MFGLYSCFPKPQAGSENGSESSQDTNRRPCGIPGVQGKDLATALPTIGPIQKNFLILYCFKFFLNLRGSYKEKEETQKWMQQLELSRSEARSRALLGLPHRCKGPRFWAIPHCFHRISRAGIRSGADSSGTSTHKGHQYHKWKLGLRHHSAGLKIMNITIKKVPLYSFSASLLFHMKQFTGVQPPAIGEGLQVYYIILSFVPA